MEFFIEKSIVWKMSVFGLFLGRIFSDWIRRDMEYTENTDQKNSDCGHFSHSKISIWRCYCMLSHWVSLISWISYRCKFSFQSYDKYFDKRFGHKSRSRSNCETDWNLTVVNLKTESSKRRIQAKYLHVGN